MGSKGKKKMVLPTRPDPPTVQQIIEDINKSDPSDPVFSILHNSNKDLNETSEKYEVEARYMQSRRYLELNERLQQARTDLIRRREELRMVGETLEQCVAEVKDRAV
ncbi:UPF0449 protein C19orf25 homolog [Trichomycterus rosablanca]|uniref:UPF0449 protein C19orf25 homolog n=1 Tax=Trichomycterus rosablanca TaxID=2290929 RepID=UPI002F351BFD